MPFTHTVADLNEFSQCVILDLTLSTDLSFLTPLLSNNDAVPLTTWVFVLPWSCLPLCLHQLPSVVVQSKRMLSELCSFSHPTFPSFSQVNASLLKETTAWLFLIQVVQQPPPPVFPKLVQPSILMLTTSDYQLEIIITPLTCLDECQQSDILLLLLNISLEFLILPNQWVAVPKCCSENGWRTDRRSKWLLHFVIIISSLQ